MLNRGEYFETMESFRQILIKGDNQIWQINVDANDANDNGCQGNGNSSPYFQ